MVTKTRTSYSIIRDKVNDIEWVCSSVLSIRRMIGVETK